MNDNRKAAINPGRMQRKNPIVVTMLTSSAAMITWTMSKPLNIVPMSSRRPLTMSRAPLTIPALTIQLTTC